MSKIIKELEIPSIMAKAQEKFRAFNIIKDDKKNLIRDLADCLEFYRKKELKEHYFSSSDESDLFKIANNFGIRHLNKNQKIDYDEHIFYDWIFNTYLNALKLILYFVNKNNPRVMPVDAVPIGESINILKENGILYVEDSEKEDIRKFNKALNDLYGFMKFIRPDNN